MDTRSQALVYAENHFDDSINFLNTLISIPSISTDPNKAKAINQCAEVIADKLSSLGINHVKVMPTAKYPVVYGDFLSVGENKPTIIIYGHYDVQPVDPIDLWSTSPFEGTIKDDYLFARGASDMKGQFVACLAAVEAIMKTGNLPVNIKFLLEGEEEIGSPSLHQFLLDNKTLLHADAVFNPDAGMLAPNIPSIVYGLRGLAYFEIRVTGPNRDLHSGSFGGIVHNPAQVLCELIAGMHDSEGRITLPGFYDSVIPLSYEEKQELARLNMDDSYYISQTGIKKLKGEEGFTAIELIGARPTLEVNGFLSGFTAPGPKTIIPSKAMAKVSMRLVPNQKSENIYDQLVEYMKTHAPNTVSWEVEKISGGNPSISDINLPETRALANALETVWGVKPIYKREGGSVPITADIQEILGIDSVLTGFGLPDDNIHSPNERLHLPTWKKGILALIHFFFNVESKKVS